MKLSPAVKQETLHIAEGTAVGVVLMLAVFALLHKLSLWVVFSGVLGGILAVLNFFLLGLTVQKVAQGEDEERGRKWMQFSYNVRMLLLVVWLIVAISVPALNWVAALIPLLMPRVTIALMQLTGHYKAQQREDTPQQ
ncbi:ATP synthase subunit I [uncultured Allofournierella sp.]|uniref:ATP synthase subunit I n=1 Tax=uncultured Allofournierella sp. TaxID=1940258 RepID=UPI003752D93C